MTRARKVVMDLDGVAVLRDGTQWFIRYDAGAHQIAMREDAISSEEAATAMTGMEGAVQVLFALQVRLLAAGIDPYASNLKR